MPLLKRVKHKQLEYMNVQIINSYRLKMLFFLFEAGNIPQKNRS